jgi:hypothetical protein
MHAVAWNGSAARGSGRARTPGSLVCLSRVENRALTARRPISLLSPSCSLVSFSDNNPDLLFGQSRRRMMAEGLEAESVFRGRQLWGPLQVSCE